MTETIEPFKEGDVHELNDPRCPFCPGEVKKEDFTTYEGIKNDSTVLSAVMEKPSLLVPRQSNARPKDGQKRNQNEDEAKLEETVREGDVYYSFQAHHCISGNQAMKNDPIEQFIKAGNKIVKDTGYSINNCANGVWLPSYPSKFKGKWSGMDGKKKQQIANDAMEKFKAQFHCGSHDIDVDGLDPKTHINYIKYVKQRLKTLNGAIESWEEHCPCHDNSNEKKHWGNVLIHNSLDGISRSIEAQLKGSKNSWRFFVSRYAKNYKQGISEF